MKRGLDGAFRLAKVALSVFGIFWLFGASSFRQLRWCNLFNNCPSEVANNNNTGGNLQDPNLISQYQQQQQQQQQQPGFNNDLMALPENYPNIDEFNNNVPYGMKRRRSVSFRQFISPVVQQLMTSYEKLAMQNVHEIANDTANNSTK